MRAYRGVVRRRGSAGCVSRAYRGALSLRFYANLNDSRTEREGDALYFTCVRCIVQEKRAAKGMPLHPCKPVVVIEYSGFAEEIDPRIKCECVSCYPDVTDDGCRCKWKFTLEE